MESNLVLHSRLGIRFCDYRIKNYNKTIGHYCNRNNYNNFERNFTVNVSFPEGYVTKRDMELYRTVVDESPLVNDHFTGSEKNPLAVCGAKPSSGFAVTQLILAVMSSNFETIANNFQH